MKRIVLFSVVLCLGAGTASLGAVLRVPSEYPTIQAAIDASVDGDTVVVAPGRYAGDGNRDIDFRGKAITVRSEAGPETCIIDARGAFAAHHRGFHFRNGETASSVLQGFTIVNGHTGGGGGAIYCEGSSPTIIDCVLTHNRARYGGGTVNFTGSWLAGDPLFANPGYWDPNGTPDNPNDDFWVDGDYHLKSQGGRWDPVAGVWVRDDVTSPCIDAGDPMSPIGHEPFPNGGRINMGAYGGTAEASKSYFGEPICETIIPGDLNGDCRVDWKDLAILARHWLRDETGQTEPPAPPR